MGHIISLVQSNSVTGKSSILAFLANSWSRRKNQVEIVDLLPKQSYCKRPKGNFYVASNFKTPRFWRSESEIQQCSKTLDIILVDCPLTPGPTLHAAARISDLIIVPCEPTEYGVGTIRLVVKTCCDEGKTCRVLLHDAGRHPADNVEIARDALEDQGAEVLETQMCNRVELSSRFLADHTLPTQKLRHSAHEEIECLRMEIDDLLADKS